jgi:hypothetical protein
MSTTGTALGLARCLFPFDELIARLILFLLRANKSSRYNGARGGFIKWQKRDTANELLST